MYSLIFVELKTCSQLLKSWDFFFVDCRMRTKTCSLDAQIQCLKKNIHPMTLYQEIVGTYCKEHFR